MPPRDRPGGRSRAISSWQHPAGMEVGEKLDVRTRAEWRRWLARNHARERQIWLVYHAKASGRSSLAYNDAVDEAICFGWIDSTGEKARPALAGAAVHSRGARARHSSEMNKARARRLVREGRMNPAGRPPSVRHCGASRSLSRPTCAARSESEPARGALESYRATNGSVSDSSRAPAAGLRSSARAVRYNERLARSAERGRPGRPGSAPFPHQSARTRLVHLGGGEPCAAA